MPYITRENKAEKIFDIGIYVILFPLDKSFYVSQSKMKSLRETYKTHYYLKNKKTMSLFEQAKGMDKIPPMYLLEEIQTSQRGAFLHCLAWTKYFQDCGYTSLAGEKIGQYVAELRDEAKDIYDSIKDKSFHEVCPDGGDLFPNFRKKEKAENNPKKKDEYKISFRVEPEEQKKIKQAAEDSGCSLSEYCRRMVIFGRVVRIDLDMFQEMSKCTKMFYERDRLLKQIMLDIHRTGKYYIADLNMMQKFIDENNRQQEKMFDELHEVLQTFFDNI